MKKIALPLFALAAATAFADSVTLGNSYNIWSSTEGLGTSTSADIIFNADGGGLFIDIDNVKISSATVNSAGGNYFQVKTGYKATVSSLVFGTSKINVFKFGTGNEASKDGYLGEMDLIVGDTTKNTTIGFEVNSGTLNVIGAGGLSGMPFTVGNKGVLNLYTNSSKTGWGTYNNGGLITVKSGGSFTAGSVVTPNINVESGGSFTSKYGIRMIGQAKTSTLDGALVVNGGQGGTDKKGSDGLTYNTRNFIFRLGNGTNPGGANAAARATADATIKMTIGASGTIKQFNGNAGYVNDILGELTVNAATGALQFQNTVTLAGKGKLILNTTNAFSTINKAGDTVLASQAGTTFNVSRKYYDNSDAADFCSDSFLVVNADNDLGALAFGNNTKLTLTVADGAIFSLGQIIRQDGCTLDYTFVLDNWHDYSFRITDMTEADINALTFVDAEGNKLDFKTVESTMGGYWINNAIPEPSTYAMVLGGLAIAFAFMRRRR